MLIRVVIFCSMMVAASSLVSACAKSVPDIHAAVKSCDPVKVNVAITAGANVETKSPDGLTPLGQAAICFDPRVVKTLLDAGAKVDGSDAQGWTPLMWAQSESVVAALLEAGANVNATNQDGETPLMFAKDAAIARRLIQAGADIHVRNKAGKTALDQKKEQVASGTNALADEIVVVLQQAEVTRPKSP